MLLIPTRSLFSLVDVVLASSETGDKLVLGSVVVTWVSWGFIGSAWKSWMSMSPSKGACSSVSCELQSIKKPAISCEEVSLRGVVNFDIFVVGLMLEETWGRCDV